ncbi:Cytochrome c-type biogenesis protein CcmH precursor [Methyloligella halotolerans]|uniref:Cytochrome c-type biogenesis protein n=1 Tax=Methyloligella halotolerans TaxID=1177755 RepID=A0A1E2RX86_9HYPH|nr:cytochrome c-type biogenesis protein [Methyloligella halotolerans]ODA66823.1 Cytochrome c-type biogenesis protein CcmH precursor [Methyloligella halotolerans]
MPSRANLRRFALSLAVALLVGLNGVAPALAVQPDEVLSDPALEQRARDISANLRCLVCQNQSIDDSNAPLAKDLRVLVREQLKAGKSDEEIMDYVVARYGEFVLLTPVWAPHTLLLWLATPILLIVGLIIVVMLFRRRATVAEPKPLSAAEKRRLNKVLDQA